MKELVKWNVYGDRPLMINRPNVDGQATKGSRRGATADIAPYDEAKAKLYIAEDGRLWFPTQGFWKAIVLACPGFQVPVGGKKRLAASGIIPPNVEPIEEEFWLLDPDTLDKKKPRDFGDKDWVVDTRMVQNPKVGGIIVSRPKFRKWGGILVFEVERDVIPAEATSVITDLLTEAGKRGVGSGRLHKHPTKSEWYGIRMGKFRVELIA